MDILNWIRTNPLLLTVLLVLAGALAAAIALTVWIVWRIRRIDLPPGADIVTALRLTPLPVVIVLDLLDLSLDIFSAPITWVLLTHLGLEPLRAVAVIKDLIPFSEPIPAMTIGWLIVRVLNPHPPYVPQNIHEPRMIEGPRRPTRR